MIAPEMLLDAAIDQIVSGGSPSFAVAIEEVRVAARLQTLTSELPPSTRRADLRRSLLTSTIPERSRRIRLALVSAPLAAVVAFSGVAYAARTAVPGDALYPIRRGLAAVRVAIAVNDRAAALLDRAQRDIVDARRLLARGDRSDAREALDVFDGDLASARAEIAASASARQAGLSARADALGRQAKDLRDRLAPAVGAPEGNESPKGPQGESTSGQQGASNDGEHSSGSGESGGSGHSGPSGSGDSHDSEISGGGQSGSSGSDASGSDASGSDASSGHSGSGSDHSGSGDSQPGGSGGSDPGVSGGDGDGSSHD